MLVEAVFIEHLPSQLLFALAKAICLGHIQCIYFSCDHSAFSVLEISGDKVITTHKLIFSGGFGQNDKQLQK